MRRREDWPIIFPRFAFKSREFEILRDYLVKNVITLRPFLQRAAQFLYEQAKIFETAYRESSGLSPLLSVGIDLEVWVNPVARRDPSGIMPSDVVAEGGMRTFAVLIYFSDASNHRANLHFFETTTPEYPVDDMRSIAWCEMSLADLGVRKAADDIGDCVDCGVNGPLDEQSRCEKCADQFFKDRHIV